MKKNWVAAHIGTSGGTPVAKAAFFGVPLHLCSCGVVPAGVYLLRAGCEPGA